jgi:paraquat-inducible protein B
VSDEPGTSPTAELEPVAVERGARVPLIWLAPIIALLVGGWLAWTTYLDTGPTITITFDVARGLEAGKTPIKFRDVPMGIVKSVDLSEDLSHVVVTAQMKKSAAAQLRSGTSFWIATAQLSAAGISGISTLISGEYIGMRPGSGEPSRTFKGLEDAPILEVSVPGKTFHLHARRLGSVTAGSPVYFRGIEVGQVLGHTLDADGSGVTIAAFVRAPHDALVRARSRFWNASGIDLALGATGLQVRTESLTAIVGGGIAFDTPVDASAGEPSTDGAEFHLYPSYDRVEEAQYTEKIPALLYFDGSVAGLDPGAPVTLRGISVGVVRDVHLEINAREAAIRIPVQVELEPQRVTVIGGDPNATPEQKVGRLVERGMRGRLAAGNLVTGAMVVALDLYPPASPVKVEFEDGIPVIPSDPSEVQQIVSKASAFLDKLSSAPLDELVTDLRNAVKEADRVLASPAFKKGIDGLHDVGPVLDSFKRTSEVARTTLAQAETTLHTADGVIGTDSALRYDLARLIKELTDTARSLHTLADFIERNPNALIFGASPSGDR